MELVFEWDANKAQRNLRNHRIDFEEARCVFDDALLVSFRDEGHSEYESA